MEEVNEKTIENMFDRIAGRYDLLNALLSMRQDARWRRKLVSWLPERERGAILDIACGTGDILATVLKQRPDYSSCVGVDISENMLAIAGKKLGNKVRLEKGSAENLVCSDDSFDAVSIGFGLRNIIDKKKTLVECFRVLKPGGALFILEFFPVPSGVLNTLFQFYFKQVLPRIGACLSDRKAYLYLPRSVEGFYTPSELGTLLEQIGFSNGRRKSFLFGSCMLWEAKKRYSFKDNLV